MTHPHKRQIEEETPVDIMSDIQLMGTNRNRIAVNNEQQEIQIKYQSKVTVKNQMNAMPYVQDMEE